jgi:hypothetical protein
MAFTGPKMDHTNLKFGFLLSVSLFNLTYRKPPAHNQLDQKTGYDLHTVNVSGFFSASNEG